MREKFIKRKTIITILVCIFLIILILIAALKGIQDLSKVDCLANLDENVMQEVGEFFNLVTRDISGVELFTELAIQDVESEAALERVLTNYCNNRVFSGLHIFYEDGNELIVGEIPKVDNELRGSFDEEIKKAPYTSDIIRDGKLRGEQYIRHAVDTTVDESNRILVYAYIPLDDFASYAGGRLYEGHGNIYIIDGTTGDYIINEAERYDEDGNEIILGNLIKREDDIITEDFGRVKEDIKNGISNNFFYDLKSDGRAYCSSYIPVGINNWSMFLTVDTKQTFKVYYYIRNTILIMTALVLLLAGIVLFSLIIQAGKNRAIFIKLLDEADAANKAKTDFMSRMSHDLRTPINGILGLSHIITSEIDDKEKITESAEKIEKLSLQLEKLVSDILEMSRVESGKVKLSFEEFSIKNKLEEISPAIISMAEERNIVLAGSHYEITHDWVYGSPLHIQRVMMNILTNAVKYNKCGGSIECWLKETPIDEKNASYTFIIKDTGIGISEEFLQTIFEPFSREHEELAPGTGLGMSITKEMVDLMGGTIDIQSTVGEGTTVTIVLELEIREKISTNDDGNGCTELKGSHILLVEDNEINQEVAEYILQDEGAIVDIAENGKIAVEKFNSSDTSYYDFILMDMRMPVMDGLEATRAIRKLDREDAKTVKIIALSANAFEEDIKKCIDAGMNSHISKPINIEQLKENLSKI